MKARPDVAMPELTPNCNKRSIRTSSTIEYWRFLLFGRSVPSALFLLLGYRQFLQVRSSFQDFERQPDPIAFLRGPLPGILLLVFSVLPVVIYLVRPRPKARDGRVVARVSAFTGTLILVGFNAFGGDDLLHAPAPVAEIADSGLVAAYGLAVWGLLFLRNSFSIIPEARRVVRTGPYRLIRHPLYSAEILAALSFLVAHPKLWPLVGFPAFVAIQVLRSVYEERLLTETFPEYAEYRRGTWRMIPLLF